MAMMSILFLILSGTVTPGEAAADLADNSPACDLVPAYSGIMADNVGTALMARDSMPWGGLIPDSIFLRYVLPVRVSQEPLTAWRPAFFDSLAPVVADAGGIAEAAVRVMAWCDEKTVFLQTQRRDQSPLVTLSSGAGRCEELTILQMDALRAVSIPCRQVYTPWWTVCDNNHAWTEVWTPAGWISTESGSAVDSLTQPTWFEANASRAALVVAVTQDSVPGAIVQRGHGCLVNVTSDYAPTGSLGISGSFGGPVYVSIVNWGALRPLVRLGRGIDRIDLGPGSYMLTWGWPIVSAVVEVPEGDSVTVTPEMGSPLPGLALLNQEAEQ
ncbi:MAG: transglutaminase-like domain-containing protein [Candidatus Fermentibacter sp.]|nr:transglutaminase-like domain-containing protein [Candidatus Fermentibacter sp.]